MPGSGGTGGKNKDLLCVLSSISWNCLVSDISRNQTLSSKRKCPPHLPPPRLSLSVSLQDVQFVRLLSTVETAQFKMKSRDLMLHEDMLQSLMELPEQYDFGAYSRFISEYGTHYVTRGILGGVLDYVVVIDKVVMEKQSKERLTAALLIKDSQTPELRHLLTQT